MQIKIIQNNALLDIRKGYSHDKAVCQGKMAGSLIYIFRQQKILGLNYPEIPDCSNIYLS